MSEVNFREAKLEIMFLGEGGMSLSIGPHRVPLILERRDERDTDIRPTHDLRPLMSELDFDISGSGWLAVHRQEGYGLEIRFHASFETNTGEEDCVAFLATCPFGIGDWKVHPLTLNRY